MVDYFHQEDIGNTAIWKRRPRTRRKIERKKVGEREKEKREGKTGTDERKKEEEE